MLVNPESGWEGQTPPADRLDEPIVGVSWFQAMAYCQWLSQKTGRCYSLPTEAQWEKAARGTDSRRYPWGDDDTPPAGDGYRLSPFGCREMVGGVREWTLSLWGRSMAALEFGYPWDQPGLPDRNDPRAGELVLRVYRGGPLAGPGSATCTSRGGFLPAKTGIKGNRHGFRVVLNSLEEGNG
jgi:formylglycine-generating enzyme required for sulfatase activity